MSILRSNEYIRPAFAVEQRDSGVGNRSQARFAERPPVVVDRCSLPGVDWYAGVSIHRAAGADVPGAGQALRRSERERTV